MKPNTDPAAAETARTTDSPAVAPSTPCCVSSEGNLRQQKMRPKILEVMDQLGGYECAKGYLRYEMMRTLNLRALHDLHDRNMQGERMDDMIDALIVDGIRSLKSPHNEKSAGTDASEKTL